MTKRRRDTFHVKIQVLKSSSSSTASSMLPRFHNYRWKHPRASRRVKSTFDRVTEHDYALQPGCLTFLSAWWCNRLISLLTKQKRLLFSRQQGHWLFCKRCLTPHYDSCSRGSLRSYPLSLAIPAIDDQKARRLSIGRPLDYHRLVIFFRRSW